MGLDQKDIDMMCVSVPTVDYWEMKDEIDRLGAYLNRLSENNERLEKIVHALVNLYHQERVKNWELILQQMSKDMDRKNGEKRKYKP